MGTKFTAYFAATALAILASSGVALAAPVVTNGSFETDAFSGSGTLGLGCSNTLSGWVAHCSPDSTYPWGLKNSNVYSGGPTPYGDQWVILGDFGGDGSWIEQSISGFTPGSSYLLSFAIASELPGGSGSTICVSFTAGSCATGTDFNAPLRGANFWDTWGTETLSFVATDPTMTIHFEGEPNAVSFDVGLDNVVISGATTRVPEPSPLILVAFGLLALGWTTRRRQIL